MTKHNRVVFCPYVSKLVAVADANGEGCTCKPFVPTAKQEWVMENLHNGLRPQDGPSGGAVPQWRRTLNVLIERGLVVADKKKAHGYSLTELGEQVTRPLSSLLFPNKVPHAKDKKT